MPDDGLTQATFAEDHVHEWKPVAHIDCCHYFIWKYECECGYLYETSQERDLSFDSYGAIWMTDDDGSPMCERCEKLLNGADLLPPIEVTKPKTAVADAPGHQHRRASDGKQA